MDEDQEIRSNIEQNMKYLEAMKQQLVPIERCTKGSFEMKCGQRYRQMSELEISEGRDIALWTNRDTMKRDAANRLKSANFKHQRYKVD